MYGVWARLLCNDQVYNRIQNIIKEGVESIPGVDFSETRELGHVNKVDPLGITYLRVRGMWGIENPWKVFNYVYERNMQREFTFMCIINNENGNLWKIGMNWLRWNKALLL